MKKYCHVPELSLSSSSCHTGKGIMPYLPSLMEYQVTVLKNSPLQKPKELSISAIGAAGKKMFCHLL